MAAKKKTQHAAPSQADPRAPLDTAAFLSAAQRVLAVLRDDLLTRADQSPGVTEALKAQWEVEREAKRTGDPWEVWRRRVVVQVAAAWVLSLVFARTLEDRGLLERNRIAGPGATDSQEQFRGIAPYLSDRDYLLTVFQELSNLPAAKDLFDPAHNPVWKLGPSIDGARALLDLFRAPDPEAPAFRFGQADTRFLGDLYQSLDEETQERFALLQTPHFVEAYILDRTLERAIARFGLDDTTIIDPTCGSGHFLLGAFDRFVDHRLRKEPGLDVREAARRAIDAVYGADINPYAVAIARFRLTLAFLERGGYGRLAEAPALPLHLVVGDSLLHAPLQAHLGDVAGTSKEAWAGREFALEDEDAAKDVLLRRYSAVVGNPPYITVKDPVLRERYREIYPRSAARTYSLGAPFTERFFLLARSTGFVGMITANSFMKREFGKKLIEEFLPNVNLDGVVNTSGAYIPGHGTPTVLLFGTNETQQGSDVLTVLAKRGEPSTPDDPARGFVWSSIADHGGEVGFENDYISVARVSRVTLEKHPWSLGGGGAAELKEVIEERATLRLADIIDGIGRTNVVGEDDVWISDRGGLERRGVADLAVPFVIGESVRDWAIVDPPYALYPYEAIGGMTVPSTHHVVRALWPWRALLERRTVFGKQMKEHRRPWWEHLEHYRDKLRGPLSIAFAFIATHNHFVLDRGGKVFNRSAPIIKLKDGATEDDHLALLAYLNSSTACFWMKQVFHDKGSGTDSGKWQSERAKIAFEFTATGLAQLPVPEFSAQQRARLRFLATEISSLAGARSTVARELVRGGVESFEAAKQRDAMLLHRAIALQEELDWIVYVAFRLVDSDGVCGETPPNAEIKIGARPFEVAAARRGSGTGIDGQRLLSADVTCPSAAVGVARLASLETESIAVLEVTEYKRRWLSTPKYLAGRVETLEDRLRPVLLDALMDSVESALRAISAACIPSSARQVEAELATNPEVLRLASLAEEAKLGLTLRVRDLLESQSVPFLAALRLTEAGTEKFAIWKQTWDLQRREDAGEHVEVPVPPKYDAKDYRYSRYEGLRGKLDVPKERFIGYPGCESDEDKEPVYGWAGWNHLQQAIALATLYLKRKQGEAWGKDRLVPMLAGLDELLPWIWQWHPDPTPESGGVKPGQYIADFLSAQCQELGVTLDELRAWRPDGAKRNGAGAAKKARAPRKAKANTEEETP